MKYDPVENPSHFGVVPKLRSRCPECYSLGRVSSSDPVAGLPSLGSELSSETKEMVAISLWRDVIKYKRFVTLLKSSF